MQTERYEEVDLVTDLFSMTFALQMRLLFNVLVLAGEVVQSTWMMWPALDQRLS